MLTQESLPTWRVLRTDLKWGPHYSTLRTLADRSRACSGRGSSCRKADQGGESHGSRAGQAGDPLATGVAVLGYRLLTTWKGLPASLLGELAGDLYASACRPPVEGGLIGINQ